MEVSKYTDWVRTQPCVVTQARGNNVDPHHIKGYSHLTMCGWASKGSDLLCIPLRHDKHQELHDIGWSSFEEKYNISQLEEAVRVMMRAAAENILIVNEGVNV